MATEPPISLQPQGLPVTPPIPVAIASITNRHAQCGGVEFVPHISEYESFQVNNFSIEFNNSANHVFGAATTAGNQIARFNGVPNGFSVDYSTYAYGMVVKNHWFVVIRSETHFDSLFTVYFYMTRPCTIHLTPRLTVASSGSNNLGLASLLEAECWLQRLSPSLYLSLFTDPGQYTRDTLYPTPYLLHRTWFDGNNGQEVVSPGTVSRVLLPGLYALKVYAKCTVRSSDPDTFGYYKMGRATARFYAEVIAN